MKTIEIDDDLYHFIASQTQEIGESASDILRRLLLQPTTQSSEPAKVEEKAVEAIKPEKAVVGSVFDVLSQQDLSAEHSVVGRFLFILSALARAHKKDFAKVLEIKGRNRLYFGRSEHELQEAGSSTNPKPIPNTDFWVITNSNTTRKKMMLTEVAGTLGYNSTDVEKIRDLL
ncbi:MULTISPECIES: replication initiation negative regulator SeqA [Rheinheimera]|uniref:Negative modulator of initiation of replication n=1 Tax=Rheinheimera marina TaxID=1774958 RepID=A0ABV9JHY6_9GAMM